MGLKALLLNGIVGFFAALPGTAALLFLMLSGD